MWLALAITIAEASPCDHKAVSEIVKHLRESQIDDTVALASLALAEACPSPRGLAENASNVAMWPPEQRTLADLKTALDSPRPWMAVCLGGHRSLQHMAELRPADQRPMLWQECDLQRHQWFSESEWNSANGTIVISLEAGIVLGEAGVPAADVRYMVRALAGLEDDDGRAPEPLFTESFADLSGLHGIDAPRGKTREAGFRGGEPEVKWSKKAKKSGGSCTVHVGVRPDGSLRKVKPIACSEAALKDVEKTLGHATLRAARDAGDRVPGRFTWSVEVY